MLRVCTAEGIAWVPYFPLGGTFPGLPKVTGEPAVHAVAESLEAAHTLSLDVLSRHHAVTQVITSTVQP